VHSEICAIPAARLVAEVELMGSLPELRAVIGTVVTRTVDKLSCIRFASARYSVPTQMVGKRVGVRVDDGRLEVLHLGHVVAAHALVAPGETSITDAHYGHERPAPRRSVRPKSTKEKAFCSIGPVAETFIKRAAASGATTLAGDLDELCRLLAAHGTEAVEAALQRAVDFGRFRAHDVRSILEAGRGVPHPSRPGEALIIELPLVASRPLSDYAVGSTS
jgi:hypothetical protein